MQGTTARGHLILAGLIGGLIGALVVASWVPPPATSSVAQAGDRLANTGGGPAEPPGTSTPPDLRMSREAVWAKQKIEAEYYPGNSVSLGTVKTESGDLDTGMLTDYTRGPRTLRDELMEHQRLETAYDPGDQ